MTTGDANPTSLSIRHDRMLREVSNRAALAQRMAFSRGSRAHHMQSPRQHAIPACFSLPIEAILASSQQHCIPDSAYAHAHVSIIKAWSEAQLGTGRLTTDSDKVQREQEDDHRARLR